MLDLYMVVEQDYAQYILIDILSGLVLNRQYNGFDNSDLRFVNHVLLKRFPDNNQLFGPHCRIPDILKRHLYTLMYQTKNRMSYMQR
jgi:hypothetical protein